MSTKGTMNPLFVGNKTQRRLRRFSWSYDEDHHIRQHSIENDLLPINEYDENAYEYDENENGQEYEYEYKYDDLETGQENVIESCEVEDVKDNGDSHPHSNSFGNSSGRRRRRPLRKVLGKGWEIPSPAVMQRRNRFREFIHDETKRHRRLVPRRNNSNNSNNRTGVDTSNRSTPPTEIRSQNVLQLLRDREVSGGGNNNGGIRRKDTRGGRSGFRIGACITTAKSASMNSPSSAVPPFTTASDTTTTTNRPCNFHSYRPITDELRTYAEQVCVTKFESSYLTHLQHQEEEDQPQEVTTNGTSGIHRNNDGSTDNGAENSNTRNEANANANVGATQQHVNTSSKAISTISIAFSPDGKTMASTHGDHTVKITCCLTGKLLQTLVGHPRTPWTVKYHPHAGANHKNSTTQIIIPNASNTSSRNTSRSSNANGRSAAARDDSVQRQQKRQQIVASGCLGHQVRIWDWISGTCLQMIRLEFAIISLSFHPSGSVLAIANGTRLHFWGLPTVTNKENVTIGQESASSEGGRIGGDGISRSSNIVSRNMHIDMRHMLRCVHFLPDGKKVIVGGVNHQTTQEMRRHRRMVAEGQGPAMSFYLRLWDFDLEATRGPPPENAGERSSADLLNSGSVGVQAIRAAAPRGTIAAESSTGRSNTTQQQSLSESTRATAAAAVAANNMTGLVTTRRRRPISNPRCFVPRALLYNDGGFDVSPDGKTLCACAEYWLPEGVDNATDLLHPQGDDDDVDCSSDGEGESRTSNNDEKDVDMDGVSSERNKVQTPERKSATKIEKNPADIAGGVASVGPEESNPSKEKPLSDSKRQAGNSSATSSHISPTRPRPSSSSYSSATPPRVLGRQSSSPPLTVGATSRTNLTTSTTNGLPVPPIQAGLTPQTPPPNVDPLNFPLSPPSPPGRRFAGGLGSTGSRGTQSSSQQQHEQLLQQYNRQRTMLHQHRHNQQHQQIMPPPQHQRGGSHYTPPSRGAENATTIPAPPGINHRNRRQHRLHTQQSSGGGLQKDGNPFANSSKSSGGASANVPRGRYVPHVVTISLDTEPYVETTTEEVTIGLDPQPSVEKITEGVTVGLNAQPSVETTEELAVGSVGVSGDSAYVAAYVAANQHTGSSLIRTATVAANSSSSSITTTVTTTTYNVPGRGAASDATRPHVLERRPRLGQLLSACPLDGTKASAVTCVKFSPCTDFCLIGYGVREPHVEEANGEANGPPAHPPYHPVTAMYKVNKGGSMRHVSTMLSGDDDVNIARFHPDSGYGFVYGTKQGRIRILGPRPWNYYH